MRRTNRSLFGRPVAFLLLLLPPPPDDNNVTFPTLSHHQEVATSRIRSVGRGNRVMARVVKLVWTLGVAHGCSFSVPGS